MAGLDQPDGGSIRIGGQDILALSDDEITLLRRRRLGLVFQAFNLLDALTAAENVSLPLVVDGVPDAEAHAREPTGPRPSRAWRTRGRHLPKEMSGGEQQRVAIARALADSTGDAFGRRTYRQPGHPQRRSGDAIAATTGRRGTDHSYGHAQSGPRGRGRSHRHLARRRHHARPAAERGGLAAERLTWAAKARRSLP